MHRLALIALVACGSAPPAQPAQPAAPATAAPAPAGGTGGHDHAQHHGHHHHQGAQPLGHRFEKADKWVPIFEGMDRDSWQQPDKVVAALELAPGMVVADVGAGTGYFEARLAAAVGASGKVIAVDIEPDMIRHMRERFSAQPTIEPRLGKPDDPALAPGSVDRIVIVDTWHHIPDRVAFSKRLAAALRPGGFVLVVDFTMETSKGPPRAHRIAQAQVERELTEAGLTPSVVAVGLPDQFVIRASR